MGDWQTIKTAIAQWIGKYGIWLLYIFIGIAVQLAMYDKNQNLSFWQRFFRVVVSICAGAIASIFCNVWKMERVAMIIVPTTTLIGQSLFEYILRKWPIIADNFLDIWVKKNK